MYNKKYYPLVPIQISQGQGHPMSMSTVSKGWSERKLSTDLQVSIGRSPQVSRLVSLSNIVLGCIVVLPNFMGFCNPPCCWMAVNV